MPRKPDGSLQTFDFGVANPPFSFKSWSSGVSTTDDPFDPFDPFNRFDYGELGYHSYSDRYADLLFEIVNRRGKIHGNVKPANSVARRAVDALFAENALTPPGNTISSLSLTLNLEILNTMPAIGLLPQSLAQTYANRGEIVALTLDTQEFLSETRSFWRTDQTITNSC